MKSCMGRAWPLLLGALALQAGCLRKSSGGGAQSPDGLAAQPVPAAELLAVQPTNTPSGVFLNQGKPFCFAGSNNYYLTYKDKVMVDDVFAQAKALGLKVLRTWAFEDRGSLDDSVPSLEHNEWEPPGTKQGVYFQYWDTQSKAPAYNEGAEESGTMAVEVTDGTGKALIQTANTPVKVAASGGMNLGEHIENMI